MTTAVPPSAAAGSLPHQHPAQAKQKEAETLRRKQQLLPTLQVVPRPGGVHGHLCLCLRNEI